VKGRDGALFDYVEQDRKVMRVVFFGLVLIVLMIAWHQRYEDSPQKPNGAPIVAENQVLLSGHVRNGTTIVYLSSGKTLHLSNGEGGFLETFANVVRRSRLIADKNQSAPIIAQLHSDGQLSVRDPQTGRTFSLQSYGEDNVAFLTRVLMGSHLINTNHATEA